MRTCVTQQEDPEGAGLSGTLCHLHEEPSPHSAGPNQLCEAASCSCTLSLAGLLFPYSWQCQQLQGAEQQGHQFTGFSDHEAPGPPQTHGPDPTVTEGWGFVFEFCERNTEACCLLEELEPF